MAQNIKTFTGATPSYNYLYGYEWLDLQAPAGNVSFTISNFPTLGTVQGFFRQDSTGGRTFTINGTDIPVNPAAGAPTWWGLAYDGTTYHPTSNYATAGSGLTQLSTPANLTATPSGSTQINLAWDNVASETNFEIQRALQADKSDAALLTSPAADTLSYGNTGLTPETAYYYRIRAVGDGTTYASSAWSAWVMATTGAAAAYETEAAAYFTRFEGAGGTLSTARKTAINDLVAWLKTEGLYTGTAEMWLVDDTNATRAAYGFKNAHNLTVAGGAEVAAGGWWYSGQVSAYLNTGVVPSTLDTTNMSLAVYLPELGVDAADNMYQIGSANAGYAANTCIITSPTKFIAAISGQAKQYTGAFAAGLHQVVTEGDVLKLYRNGTLLTTTTLGPRDGNSNSPLYLLANNVNGSAEGFGHATVGFAYVGPVMSATQAAAFSTKVQAIEDAA